MALSTICLSNMTKTKQLVEALKERYKKHPYYQQYVTPADYDKLIAYSLQDLLEYLEDGFVTDVHQLLEERLATVIEDNKSLA